MKNLVITVLLTLALEAGVVTVGAEHANASTGTKLCVADTVNGGKVCGRVIKYKASSRVTKEGLSLIDSKHLPIDEYVKVTYLGWTSKRGLSNGDNVWAVKSKIKAHRYHEYKIRVMTLDEVYEMGANDGADQLCTELGGKGRNGLCDIEFAS